MRVEKVETHQQSLVGRGGRLRRQKDEKPTQRVNSTRWGVEVVGEMDEKATQRVISTRWVVEEAGVEMRPNQGVLRTPWLSFWGSSWVEGIGTHQRDGGFWG